MSSKNAGTRKGFTLVELAVVIVIIGVLAAFGVPRFLKSVERSKAAEAFQYLSAVRAAQERFLSKNGIYYAGTPDANGLYPNDTNGETLDITQSVPKYFTAGEITIDNTTPGDPLWEMQLTRVGGSSSYGSYTVTFTQDGFVDDIAKSSIVTYPEINPMGSSGDTAEPPAG